MEPFDLKERLSDRRPVTGAIINILSPPIVEILGEFGVDFVIIDAEHSSASLETIETLVLAAKTVNLVPLVRVPGHGPDYTRRVLDLGASGVVVPRIESRKILDDVVSASKYHPDGSRGICTLTRSSRYTFRSGEEELKSINEETIVIGIVESESAVENIDEIFGTSTLDAALLGPGDLSQSMGMLGGLDNPSVREKLHEVISAGQDHDVPIGAYSLNTDDAEEWLDQGADFTFYSDVRIFKNALEEQLLSD